MSITAEKLKKSGAKGQHITLVVDEQLRLIDDKLQKHERVWGLNVVPYDIPVVFSSLGLERKVAQMIIYATVIRSLESRGFGVALVFHERPERAELLITWVTDIDEDEVRSMNKLIKRVVVRPNKVEEHLEKMRAATRPRNTAAPPAATAPTNTTSNSPASAYAVTPAQLSMPDSQPPR